MSKLPTRRAAPKRSVKTRRIFISLPADNWLTPRENATKWAIVEAVEALHYTSEVFLDPRGTRSLAASQAWTAEACEAVMRRCEGCVLLGFPRWRIPSTGGSVQLSTEYNNYEGAVAHTLNLPLLVLVQDGVERRVVFDPSYKGFVGTIPSRPTPKWLAHKQFTVPFGFWREKLEQRRDVFLGYCGSSEKTASKIRSFLKVGLGLSVLDWKADFDPAVTILQRIEEASKRCGAGIFLFTKDDKLAAQNSPKRAVPRDNVVFEAGYFSSVKGKPKVLIVLEQGAKMPADLGGDIYASLENRLDINPIKETLRRFATSL